MSLNLEKKINIELKSQITNYPPSSSPSVDRILQPKGARLILLPFQLTKQNRRLKLELDCIQFVSYVMSSKKFRILII